MLALLRVVRVLWAQLCLLSCTGNTVKVSSVVVPTCHFTATALCWRALVKAACLSIPPGVVLRWQARPRPLHILPRRGREAHE